MEAGFPTVTRDGFEDAQGVACGNGLAAPYRRLDGEVGGAQAAWVQEGDHPSPRQLGGVGDGAWAGGENRGGGGGGQVHAAVA
ncbi:hypothetical protein GCM10010404_65790 [Nonomuraea africana]